MDPIQAFAESKKLIISAPRVIIISHKNPDADALGANLALREAIENIGKNEVISFCVDPPSTDSMFLRKANLFTQEIELREDDLLISVDCGNEKMLGCENRFPEILNRKKHFLINIDHHAGNDFFGNLNIVMPETPATCFILYHMFNAVGWTISKSMAEALLHGLYYDTGSFMHSNTSAQVLRMAGNLKRLGASHENSVKMLFKTQSIKQMRLWGMALEKIIFTKQNGIISALLPNDFERTGTKKEDASGLVPYLNQVKEANFCLLLCESEIGEIKGSLRTQNDNVDLSEIAGLMGGGGHKKASGFTVKGHLKQNIHWSLE